MAYKQDSRISVINSSWETAKKTLEENGIDRFSLHGYSHIYKITDDAFFVLRCFASFLKINDLTKVEPLFYYRNNAAIEVDENGDLAIPLQEVCIFKMGLVLNRDLTPEFGIGFASDFRASFYNLHPGKDAPDWLNTFIWSLETQIKDRKAKE